MNTSTSTQSPVIAAHERIIPAADNASLMRRIDDLPLPGRPLDWDDGGTPIEGNVVYQYHPRGERFARWADIRTQEQLLDIQAAPNRFEVRTLFTVPVDALALNPVTLVAAAQAKLDRIDAALGKSIASFRAAMREIAGKS